MKGDAMGSLWHPEAVRRSHIDAGGWLDPIEAED
jgi:hypothetical protein